MDLNEISYNRRKPLALQLAPMIDIFTLIIVFLLKSTVVADVAIVFPSQLEAAVSTQKDSLESFPEIILYNDHLEASFLDLKKPLSEINNISSAELTEYKRKAEVFRSKSDNFSKSTVININLLAGRDNNYKNVFDTVKFLRQIGFQSIQFIAENEMKQ